MSIVIVPAYSTFADEIGNVIFNYDAFAEKVCGIENFEESPMISHSPYLKEHKLFDYKESKRERRIRNEFSHKNCSKDKSKHGSKTKGRYDRHGFRGYGPWQTSLAEAKAKINLDELLLEAEEEFAYGEEEERLRKEAILREETEKQKAKEEATKTDHFENLLSAWGEMEEAMKVIAEKHGVTVSEVLHEFF